VKENRRRYFLSTSTYRSELRHPGKGLRRGGPSVYKDELREKKGNRSGPARKVGWTGIPSLGERVQLEATHQGKRPSKNGSPQDRKGST